MRPQCFFCRSSACQACKLKGLHQSLSLSSLEIWYDFVAWQPFCPLSCPQDCVRECGHTIKQSHEWENPIAKRNGRRTALALRKVYLPSWTSKLLQTRARSRFSTSMTRWIGLRVHFSMLCDAVVLDTGVAQPQAYILRVFLQGRDLQLKPETLTCA